MALQPAAVDRQLAAMKQLAAPTAPGASQQLFDWKEANRYLQEDAAGRANKGVRFTAIDPRASRWTCRACGTFVLKPFEVSPCLHWICGDCHDAAKKKGSSNCPACTYRAAKIELSATAAAHIETLRVQCDLCGWVGMHRYMKTHADGKCVEAARVAKTMELTPYSDQRDTDVPWSSLMQGGTICADCAARLYAIAPYETQLYRDVLSAACRDGHTNCVKVILAYKPSLITKPWPLYEDSPLISAASFGHIEVCSLLIAAGAPVNLSNARRCQPLMAAASLGHSATMELLIKSGASLEQIDHRGDCAFYYVCKRGFYSAMQVLLHHGVSANEPFLNGWTPLTVCCSRTESEDGRDPASGVYADTIAAVELLLSYGGDVNQVESHGLSPLHMAIAQGATELARLLLSEGADPNFHKKTRFEVKTLLAVAVTNGSIECYKMLRNAGADPLDAGPTQQPLLLTGVVTGAPIELLEMLIADGCSVHESGGARSCRATALAVAVEAGNLSAMDVLIAHGIDLNVQDKSGHTALMTAATKANHAALVKLLKAGADPNIRSESGMTALMWAAKTSTTSVTTLLQHGADAKAIDGSGATALHHAMTPTPTCTIEVLRALIAAGVDPNAVNNDGRRALHMAAAAGRRDCMSFLVGTEGVETRFVDGNGLAFVSHVARYAHYDLVAAIQDLGVDFNEPNAEGAEAFSALAVAARRNDAIMLHELLTRGSDARQRDERTGATALHAAAAADALETADVLIASCPELVDMADHEGRKPADVAPAAGKAISTLRQTS